MYFQYRRMSLTPIIGVIGCRSYLLMIGLYYFGITYYFQRHRVLLTPIIGIVECYSYPLTIRVCIVLILHAQIHLLLLYVEKQLLFYFSIPLTVFIAQWHYNMLSFRGF